MVTDDDDDDDDDDDSPVDGGAVVSEWFRHCCHASAQFSTCRKLTLGFERTKKRLVYCCTCQAQSMFWYVVIHIRKSFLPLESLAGKLTQFARTLALCSPFLTATKAACHSHSHSLARFQHGKWSGETGKIWKEVVRPCVSHISLGHWTYCGWKKSCITLDGWNPINNGNIMG